MLIIINTHVLFVQQHQQILLKKEIKIICYFALFIYNIRGTFKYVIIGNNRVYFCVRWNSE